MREQEADRLAIVRTSAGFSKRRADIDRLDSVAHFLLILVGDGVGNDETLEAAVIQVVDGTSGENSVDNDGVDFLGAVLHYRVGGLDEGSAGVCHVVNDDGGLVLDVPD